MAKAVLCNFILFIPDINAQLFSSALAYFFLLQRCCKAIRPKILSAQDSIRSEIGTHCLAGQTLHGPTKCILVSDGDAVISFYLFRSRHESITVKIEGIHS